MEARNSRQGWQGGPRLKLGGAVGMGSRLEAREWSNKRQSPANSISEQAGHFQVNLGLALGSGNRDCMRHRSGPSGLAKHRSLSTTAPGAGQRENL